MRAFTRMAGTVALVAAVAAGVLVQGAPAAADAVTTPVATTRVLPRTIAYLRAGNLYLIENARERQLTSGGGYSRPRFSPDGSRLAYLHGGQLWTMAADGTRRRQLTTIGAAGASWSPDGRWLAFAALGCTGGPVVYRVAADAVDTTPEVLFPADCRGQELPDEPADGTGLHGALAERLRSDDAVAWSPDGSRVAFRGGQCESIYDACLSIGTIATGGERVVAAYGGGGRQNSGFAVVPSWRADGARLSFTAYRKGETRADDQPVHLEEYDPATGVKRVVGSAQDRELAYVDAARGVATGQYRGGSWVMLVDLVTGAHTPLHAGSQPSVQPTH